MGMIIASDALTFPIKVGSDEIVPHLVEGAIPPPSKNDMTIPRNDKEAHRAHLLYSQRMHQDYMSRTEKDNPLLWSRDINNVRIINFRSLVSNLNQSHAENIIKIQSINAWVNEAIYYFDTDATKAQTAYETLSSGIGTCADIARLKYEMLKSVGIEDGAMRLVGGPIYNEEGVKLDDHEVLMVNAQGYNWILNDNAVGGHFIAEKPLLCGGIEPSEIFIHGKSGGSVANNYGSFIPVSAENRDGTKAYPITYDQNGNYALPSDLSLIPTMKREYSEVVCTKDKKFCFDIGPHGVDGYDFIVQTINQAIEQRTTPETLKAPEPRKDSSKIPELKNILSRSHDKQKKHSIIHAPTRNARTSTGTYFSSIIKYGKWRFNSSRCCIS